MVGTIKVQFRVKTPLVTLETKTVFKTISKIFGNLCFG